MLQVIINGVGRYLPVVNELDVPEFMDTAGPVWGLVPALPKSRIPGVC